VDIIKLNDRQEKILEIVKERGPITGEKIAEILNVTRATLRPDLAVLTMSEFLEAKPRVGYTYKSEGFGNKMRKLLNQYRVRDLMSLPIVLKDNCSIYDAIVTLFMEDTGTIFIVDEQNYLCGIVSRKDFIKSTLGQADIHKMPVSIIMTRMPNIITIGMDDTVMEAIKKIVEHEVDGLPVVRNFIDPEGEEKLEVVGKFTKTNIVRFLLDLASEGN
jgi:CBS domain-containing protein